MNFAKKVAIVTRAGTEIGEDVALELLRAGNAVALAGRRCEPLETVAGKAKELNARS